MRLLVTLAFAPLAWGRTPSSLFLSVGFTSDMVLKSAPNQASIYGLVVPAARGVVPVVTVTLAPSAGLTPAAVVVPAAVASDQGGGTPCDQQCYDQGFNCSLGNMASGGTSCNYGCLFAGVTPGYAECARMCDTVQCGAEFEGYALSCSGCGAAVPGTRGGAEECYVGCSNTFNATAPALSFKALLPPQPPGGEYTLTVACTAGCPGTDAGAALVLQRVTFGEVFYCAGQSK